MVMNKTEEERSFHALTGPRAVSYGASIKGEDHKENEDTILVEDRLGLYAVADGVTMPYGGGPASRLVISSLRSLFKGDLVETIGASQQYSFARKEEESWNRVQHTHRRQIN
jgi:serine/threonine protein phosphatase PrpC